MKHVALKMLAVQECLTTGRVRIHIMSTHDNPTDLMTKAMTREKLLKFRRASNFRGASSTSRLPPRRGSHDGNHDGTHDFFLILQLDRTKSNVPFCDGQ